MMRWGPLFLLAASIACGSSGASRSADRPERPPLGSTVELVIPHLETAQNGVGTTLVTGSESSANVMTLALVLPVGQRHEPSGKEGLASITATLIEETGRDRALTNEPAIGAYGGEISAWTTRNSLVVSTTALRDEASQAMRALADAVFDFEVDTQRLHRVLSTRMGQVSGQAQDERALALLAVSEAMYGEAALGLGSDRSLQSITAQDVIAFLKAGMHTDGVSVVAIGTEDLNEANGWVAPALARWPTSGPDLRASPSLRDCKTKGTCPGRLDYGGRNLVFVPLEGLKRSFIAWGSVAPAPQVDPTFDLASARALTWLGYQMRSEKQISYGIYPLRESVRGGHVFAFVSYVDPERTLDALRQARKVLSRLDNDNAAAFVELKHHFMVGEMYQGQFTGTLVRRAVLGIEVGSVDAVETYYTRLRNAKFEAVREVVRTRFDPDELVVVVVGSPQLRAELAARYDVTEMDATRLVEQVE